MPDLQLTHIPSMNVGMLIRKPAREVFAAVVDPSTTTKFWFTKSSGPLAPGARVQWEWEMYGATAGVRVIDFEQDRRIKMEWGQDDEFTTVEFRFIPHGAEHTFVDVTENGFSGKGDAVLDRVAGSTGGFTIMLCALKALLEHDVVLTAVADRFPSRLTREEVVADPAR